MTFWQATREWMKDLQDCSRCMGWLLAVIVLLLAAVKLDPAATKEILLAGMGLATSLVGFGAGANARGKSIDAQNAASTATAAASAQGIVDPNASRNG